MCAHAAAPRADRQEGHRLSKRRTVSVLFEIEVLNCNYSRKNIKILIYETRSKLGHVTSKSAARTSVFPSLLLRVSYP